MQERNNHMEGQFWTIERQSEPRGGYVGKVTIFVRDRRWMARIGILHESENALSPTQNESAAVRNVTQRKKGSRKRIADEIDLITPLASPPKNVAKEAIKDFIEIDD